MLGLGWDMGIALSVAVNHKGTFVTDDDVFYANLGAGGGGQLIQNASGKYFIANNPYVNVSYQQGTGALAGQIESWIFQVRSSGIKYIFGKHDTAVSNCERVVYHTNDAIHLSPFSKDSAGPYIYKWDLQKITDAEDRNEIIFEYQQFNDTVFGKAFTREAYVKSIKWLDRKGGEAMRWDFTMGSKTIGEYFNGDTAVPNTNMTPYESKYLSKIEESLSGIKKTEVDFNYTIRGSGNYKKRFLDSVLVSDRLSKASNTFVNSRPWKFEYGADSLFNVLSKVTEPSGTSTEFQFQAAPFGAEAQQSGLDTLRDVNKAPISFINHGLEENNRTTCDERFCYLEVDSVGVHGHIRMEIVHNPGNYFDTTHAFIFGFFGTGSQQTQWRYIPFGDFLFVYDANDSTLHQLQWDGERWSQKADMKFNSFGNTTQGITVYPALNYFIVAERGPTKTKTWIMLREDSTWDDVNAQVCAVGNNSYFGDSVKTPGDGCMLWRSGVSVSVSENLFTIVHDSTNVIYAYRLKQDGSGFDEVSGNFNLLSSEIQDNTNNHHNNWNKEIKEMTLGEDYLLIRSDKGGGSNQQRVDIFHFDGYRFHGIDSSGWEAAGLNDLRSFPGNGYFITANQNSAKHEVRYWKERLSGDSLYFSKTQVRSDLPVPDTSTLIVRTSPAAFTIQYARPASTSQFGNDAFFPRIGADSNYQSYLYQVATDTTSGLRDRSADLQYLIGPTQAKMTNISFSGSDNMLTAMNFRRAGDVTNYALCSNDTSTCGLNILTAKVNRLAAGSSPFLFSKSPIDGVPASSLSKNVVLTNASRLGVLSLIDLASPYFIYRPNAYDGNDCLGAPDSIHVVKAVVQRTGLDGVGLDVTTTFTYGTTFSEFNIFSQSPMYDSTAVSQVDSNGVALGKSIYNHNLDLRMRPLVGKNLKLNGALKKTLSYDKGGNLMSAQTQYFRPDTVIALDPTWPGVISLSQLDSSLSQDIRPNKSMMTQKVSHHSYNFKTGMPRFTKDSSGGFWNLSQTVFNDSGLPKETYSYVLSSEPVNAVLDTLKDKSYDSLNAVAGSKVEYSSTFPYRNDKDSIWRDVDESFTDDSLRKGSEPVYNLKQNWLPRSLITLRDSLNLPQEIETVKDTQATALGASFSSTFYEGKYSLPIGTISNAKLKNCSILTAENGTLVGLTTHDFEGRWESGADSGFSSKKAHTGDYSIKVKDNYGPTTNIFLQDVRTLGFDYVISAWIYAESGVTPVMTVERCNSSGASIDSYTGSVIGGVIHRRQWQRWEATVTNAQLIAGSLFNGNADFLRVWIGTGAPAGQSTRIVYVDDIICRPSISPFTMMTYDYRGLPSSTTDTQHLTHYSEQDFLGHGLVSREERFRSYSQSAEHRLGENQ
ncbi:MAG: hypothetical protein JWO30_3179 [Fibrobacteres bacterium]|nr:hypothetical protein [Fibrobacterota bacterium]